MNVLVIYVVDYSRARFLHRTRLAWLISHHQAWYCILDSLAMSQDNSLLVNTRSGPVLGFQDTFPISDRSNAELIAKGEIGQHSPVNKWLVSWLLPWWDHGSMDDDWLIRIINFFNSLLKGIPYAQAARWKRPTPPESWQEPLACHEFGWVCFWSVSITLKMGYAQCCYEAYLLGSVTAM